MRALILLSTALSKALAPGERWITVRPPGHDKGQPLLVKPTSDGAMKVIGGAGGSMNHLRLTGVRSEAEYAHEARQKAATRKEARKRQVEQDRKLGLSDSKGKAKEAIRAQLADHQAKLVQTVADALKWTPEQMRFPEEQFANATPEAQQQAAKEHAQTLLQRAREAIQHQRKVLVQDAETRAQAGLAEVPLTSAAPEDLTVQDLDPIAPATKGLGYSTDYEARAEAAGLTPDKLADQAAAAKPQGEKPSGAAEATAKRKEVAERVAKELKDIREPGPTVDPHAVVDAKVAVELLKAEKAFRAVKRDAAEKGKLIDAAKEPVEPKAFVLETGAPVEESDITRDIENDLRTLRTRAFLDEVGNLGEGQESLGKHIGVGAYNSINAAALAAGGASLVDRSVVDVLGIAGAAQVLARRLSTDLTPAETDDLRAAMSSFHVEHYMALSDQAIREARDLHEMANEIDIGSAGNGHDLAVAQELNARRREFTDAAQRTLGTALGEMEANAALVTALNGKAPDKVHVSLGRTTIERAIQQAHAIGLQRGEFTVERAGASTIMTVHGPGMDKLAQPVSRADMLHTRKALDIMEGREDEENWLPQGVARRPEMAMTAEPGVAPRLAKPFAMGKGGADQAIADYVGGRTADGDAPADIMAGLLSEDTLRAAGNRKDFMAALDKVAPLYDQDGGMIRAETHQDAFNKMADDFTERTYGAERTPLHRQQFPVDQLSVNALHTALAEHPAGPAAFKPVGDLSPQDQGALRAVFGAEHGRVDAGAAAAQDRLAKLSANEPAKETQDMFGTSTNPEWTAWKAERDGLAEQVNKATMTWGKYVDVMGSPSKAYAAVQDTLKGKVLDSFARQHNLHRPGAALKTGRTVIANDLNHLDALDPAARERRLAEHRERADSLRTRVAGKYAAGSVSDKMDAARAADEAAAQSQMGLFGAEDPAPSAAAPERPMELGERRTIGHAAEQQVAGMMPIVGRNFTPGQPVKLWEPTMSGKYVGRQRAVKLIEHDKRIALGLGVGSGKTAIGLAAFAHLHAKEKAKRGLFVVPSIVQGQFGAEAQTVLEPGKFAWHADPSASRAERLAALKDPSVDFNVVTHQALRDDVLHLASKAEGTTPDAVADKMAGMSRTERRDFVRGVLDKEGINHDLMMVDEGHNLLNRAGKADSRMANTLDAMADGMGHYINATADPVKNDPSEAFDVLAKMDPARYRDRDAFLRKYGVDTEAARDGLRREMARHFYTGKIDPGVKAEKKVIPVELSAAQHARLRDLSHAAAAGRAARMKKTVDVEAMKTLSPNAFKDVDPARHEEVAKNLQASIGIIHNTAVHNAIDSGAKTEALAKLAHERRGKPGVVFAHRLDAVKDVADRLRAEGHRVATLTGGHSSAEKDRIKREYQDGKHDILVASDAGAVGANLQRGQWLAQYDSPQTAMLHAQRNGRIHRMGQKNDVELLDLVANHPAEARARKRLTEKYGLRDVMTSPLEGLDDHGIAGALNRVRAARQDAVNPVTSPL